MAQGCSLSGRGPRLHLPLREREPHPEAHTLWNPQLHRPGAQNPHMLPWPVVFNWGRVDPLYKRFKSHCRQRGLRPEHPGLGRQLCQHQQGMHLTQVSAAWRPAAPAVGAEQADPTTGLRVLPRLCTAQCSVHMRSSGCRRSHLGCISPREGTQQTGRPQACCDLLCDPGRFLGLSDFHPHGGAICPFTSQRALHSPVPPLPWVPLECWLGHRSQQLWARKPSPGLPLTWTSSLPALGTQCLLFTRPPV